MKDFWKSSGFHLLERDADGQLAVTEGFLAGYLGRPELAPVDESCAAEIALHGALMDNPRLAVDETRIATLEDADARDNYRVMLGFRDQLVKAGTVEACYLNIARNGADGIPPLFIDQMAHVIARNLLDGCADPIRLRAAELLFRQQNVRLLDGAIMLADREVVEMHAATGGLGNFGKLFAESGTPTRSVDLDVLSPENAELYWGRDEAFDTVLDVSFGRPGLIALCKVLEDWLRHFLGVEVRIEPVGMIRDERWVWHVGLDAESNVILNDLYEGQDLGEDRLRQILSLFRLSFRDSSQMRADLAGRPVYLGMAMDGANILRLKPQNLLANLPLADAS